MTDLQSATRWLAGITSLLSLALCIALGGQCNELQIQRAVCAERVDAHKRDTELLIKSLETAQASVKSASVVIDRVSRIDYFLEQGHAMERFRTLLTADLDLKPAPNGLGIGGCE